MLANVPGLGRLVVDGSCGDVRRENEGWSGVEEFLDGDGLVAAWAEAAWSELSHERPALAALLAEEPGFAIGALIDGVGFAWTGGG